MNIRGNIVVKPHILKFICWLENLQQLPSGEIEPLDISDSGIVGLSLKVVLCYKTETEQPLPEKLSDKYSAVLPYLLPKRAWDRGKLHISKDDIITFNSQMHTLMHEFILRRIIEYTEKGKFAKEAINDFLIEIDAEELVHRDSVTRVNQRLRKSKKIATFYDKKVKSRNQLVLR